MSKRSNKRARVYRILNKERKLQEFCWNCGNTSVYKFSACHSTRNDERPTDDDHPDNWKWYFVAWNCFDCTIALHQLHSEKEKRKIIDLRAKIQGRYPDYIHPEVQAMIEAK